MRGISPIIAEVIIVAVAISLAITVSLFFSGIIGTYMKLPLTTSYTVVLTNTPLTGRGGSRTSRRSNAATPAENTW